jgi:hypothetical protein
MRDRLRRLFDLVDPMPEATAAPVDPGWARLAALPELVGTRDHGPALSFGLGDLTVHVEVGPLLTGIVTPPVAEVVVRWVDGMTWAAVDEHGMFEVDDVPRGPVRLVIGDAVTDWFVR